MRVRVLGLIIVVTVSSLVCHAQVAPVVAKQRVVSEVLDGQGNVVSHSEKLGRFLRNSAGSELTQEYAVLEGRLALRSGELEDYSRHRIYQLNYGKHEAAELAELPGEPHPGYFANTRNALGKETVNGIPCLIHPIFMMVDGKKLQIGKKYDSAEYGLGIKEDAIIEPPGGPRTHRIVELYDIQSVEPDPKEFDLEKFSFVGKRPLSCVKQGAAAVLDSSPLK